MPTSRTAWATRAERTALELHPSLLREARANSRALGCDLPFLMGLAREVALARGPELTLAYKNVVMVQPGFKKRRRRGVEQLTRTPCVIFVVRKKLTVDTAARDPAQHLPPWLVAFADHGGRRLPFALPTDVQPQTLFKSARAHGGGSVWLQPPGVDAENGTVTCAVELKVGGKASTYLLSAQHVFTPCADVASMSLQGGVQARPRASNGTQLPKPVLATTKAAGGLLRGDENPHRPSLDLQLATINDKQAARSVVAASKLHTTEPWVESPTRLLQLAATRWFHMLVPDNNASQARGPLEMGLDAPLALPFPLSYRVRRGTQVQFANIYHDELLKFLVRAPTNPLSGDSGSAVVVLQPHGAVTLVGMYIGGDGTAAYAIPAWRLFDLGLWWDFPPGSSGVRPVSL